MEITAKVLFDGRVFHPQTPLDLEPNTLYDITIKPRAESASKAGSLWDLLGELAGTVEAPPDWAEEHDHYIHGTPKRGTGPAT